MGFGIIILGADRKCPPVLKALLERESFSSLVFSSKNKKMKIFNISSLNQLLKDEMRRQAHQLPKLLNEVECLICQVIHMELHVL